MANSDPLLRLTEFINCLTHPRKLITVIMPAYNLSIDASGKTNVLACLLIAVNGIDENM
jgi:hypothetical protein